MSRRRDPAPSRARYRIQRLFLRPAVQRAIRIGPIAAVIFAIAGYFLLSSDARQGVAGLFGDARAAVVNREEFRVDKVAILGASPALEELVRGMAAAHLPASSFKIDLKALKIRIESLPPVAEAAVRIGKGGTLSIDLTEREPMFVWRVENRLYLLDAEGVALAQLQRRTDRPQLPLVIGPGADRELAQARELLLAAAPIVDRVRALQRIGGRRWNVVLDRDQLLMLPEQSPVTAFRRIMGLNTETDLLNRDVSAVDFRDPNRPTLRMGPFATSELRQLQALQRGDAE